MRLLIAAVFLGFGPRLLCLQRRERHSNIVWPSNPGRIDHPNIRVTMTSDQATAVSDTKIGTTTRKDNDRWTLEKRGGKWQITSLTFGLSR